MKSFISWIYTFALSIGGPGLFVVAFLDSSFVSLPEINDLLIVLMVTEHPQLMAYYAIMTTLGSISGCLAIYYVARKGGDAFLRKRLKESHIDGALGVYRRYGVLALMVPALLPPPAPFKIFVLLAGVANVRPLKFVAAVGVARGLRYFFLGFLAVEYGDAALELMRTRGRDVALVVVGLLLAGAVGWWLWRRRRRSQPS